MSERTEVEQEREAKRCLSESGVHAWETNGHGAWCRWCGTPRHTPAPLTTPPDTPGEREPALGGCLDPYHTRYDGLAGACPHCGESWKAEPKRWLAARPTTPDQPAERHEWNRHAICVRCRKHADDLLDEQGMLTPCSPGAAPSVEAGERERRRETTHCIVWEMAKALVQKYDLPARPLTDAEWAAVVATGVRLMEQDAAPAPHHPDSPAISSVPAPSGERERLLAILAEPSVTSSADDLWRTIQRAIALLDGAALSVPSPEERTERYERLRAWESIEDALSMLDSACKRYPDLPQSYRETLARAWPTLRTLQGAPEKRIQRVEREGRAGLALARRLNDLADQLDKGGARGMGLAYAGAGFVADLRACASQALALAPTEQQTEVEP